VRQVGNWCLLCITPCACASTTVNEHVMCEGLAPHGPVQCILVWRFVCKDGVIYRVSREKCIILREGVPYVKIYRYNPKHLYPKLNGYGDNGQRSLEL
jgi:hypothetical protein